MSSTGDEDSNGLTAADTRPAVTRGLTFDECLVFTIDAEWGHFRRVKGNVTKQTYRVMPRTTVAGLCAAICGWDRDSYYGEFSPDRSAMAIEPLNDANHDIRTTNIPVNALSTAKEDFHNKYGHKTWPIPRVRLVDPTRKRQQHNYEVLVDPGYRIYVYLSGDLYDELRSHLSAGTSVYTTSLGLSEYLASVTYEGETQVTHKSASEIDGKSVTSAVPMGPRHVAPKAGIPMSTERSPGFMERVPGRAYQRRTTGFVNWTYSHTAESLTVTDDTPVSTVKGVGRVVFI
jgi:CRISPR-associated protein Cas5h